MRLIRGCAIGIVLASTGAAATVAAVSPIRSAAASSTSLPDTASLRATIFGLETAAPASLPERIPVRELNLDLGVRATPELFWFNRKLRVWYSAQRDPAPLVVVIPGVGGDGSGGKIPVLRAALYDAGYHVLTMPSPTFGRFIVAASSTGVVGDLGEDAADLDRAIRHAIAALPGRVEINGLHVVGYSLGGAHAAVLKARDTGPEPLGLERVVMINPPVSLYDSIRRLDALFEATIGRDHAEVGDTFRRLYGDLASHYREAEATVLDQEFLLRAAAHLLREDRELAGAIALSFRISLANMIFIGDYFARTGVLVDPAAPPGPGDPMDDYLYRLRTVTFEEYVEQIYLPFHLARQPERSRRALVAATSLELVADHIESGPDYYAQHSADDFILDDADLAWLRETLGARLAVYEEGGHLGAIGERRQVEDMLAMLDGKWPGRGDEAR